MSSKVEQAFLEKFYKNRFSWSHDFLINLLGMIDDEFVRRVSDYNKFLSAEDKFVGGDVIGIQDD